MSVIEVMNEGSQHPARGFCRRLCKAAREEGFRSRIQRAPRDTPALYDMLSSPVPPAQLKQAYMVGWDDADKALTVSEQEIATSQRRTVYAAIVILLVFSLLIAG